MVASLILLVLLAAAVGLCNATSAYNLVPRSAARIDARELQAADSSASVSPLEGVSFDGDLDAIKALALAKANRGNGRDSFSCDDVDPVHLEILNWKYSIETVPAADVPTVIGEVQEIALDQVGPVSLSCLNKASAYANIVSMDTDIPGDQESKDTCDPVINPSYKCTVVIGRMRLFLSSKDSAEVATALVLETIKNAFSETDFVEKVDSGLISITFIDDAGASSPSAVKDETEDKNSSIGQEGDSALGLTLSSMLFVAVGSAALVVFVGSVYIWRRREPNDDRGGAATRFADSTANGTSRLPTSPYSEMVSGSYRLDRLGEMSILSNSNMSPVYEQDQEDADTAAGSVAGSVVLSDGGYTTDAGCTDGGDSTYLEGGSSKYSSQSTPKFLGARPFPGTVNMDMEEISDSDLDTSGEMSPVKMYVGNKLLVPTGGDLEEESLQADESLLFSPRTEKDASDIESISSASPSPSP